MANMPTAEIPLDQHLVTQLLQEQHPDLAHLPVHTLANGWDNEVFRLGKNFIVRLPRREISVQLIRNEQLFLPQIAELTSLNLPVPLRLGRPSETFPWPWSITPWFDGAPAILSAPADHAQLVPQVADFLAAIHRPAPRDAPRNPVRGVPLQQRDRAFRDRVTPARFPQHAEILALWQQCLAAPRWQREPYWLHGDLHSANILVHADKVSAIIDFGDLGCGDPAVDLAVGWMLFETADRLSFQRRLEERIGSDPALWQRARGWALNLATVMLTQSDDSPDFLALGQHTLKTVLAD